MRPVDPDRHEKSREARDAAWKKHEPNWRFRAPPLTFIVAWNAALDHAAQEQPCLECTTIGQSACPDHAQEQPEHPLAKLAAEQRSLTPEERAVLDHHFWELIAQEQPAPPAARTQSARDWMEERRSIYTGLAACHAIELADRADAAEAWKRSAMVVLSEWDKAHVAAGKPGKLGESMALATAREIESLRTQLAAAQDEARRLREALENLCIAVTCVGVRHPKEREILQEYYDAARAALAAQKEGKES
jgi:hypothetical protein